MGIRDAIRSLGPGQDRGGQRPLAISEVARTEIERRVGEEREQNGVDLFILEPHQGAQPGMKVK